MIPARRTFSFAAALALSSWACREKDEPRKVEREQSPTPAAQSAPSTPAAPWFSGRFQATVPLRELPRAPELLRKKKSPPELLREIAETAELTLTIDREGSAHITLTGPFKQETQAQIEADEVRARFVPSPDALGSGTLVLRRSGDSFEGMLSLLDPSRTRPLTGRIEPSAFRKEN